MAAAGAFDFAAMDAPDDHAEAGSQVARLKEACALVDLRVLSFRAAAERVGFSETTFERWYKERRAVCPRLGPPAAAWSTSRRTSSS